MRWLLAASLVALSACAPTSKENGPAGPVLAAAKARCVVWGMPGAICPGDPIRVKMCPDRAYLLWADGREQPMPDDYFGGVRIVPDGEVAHCPDGSRARAFASPQAPAPQ